LNNLDTYQKRLDSRHLESKIAKVQCDEGAKAITRGTRMEMDFRYKAKYPGDELPNQEKNQHWTVYW